METRPVYIVRCHTDEYAMCQVVNKNSPNYGKYVALKCTCKYLNYWEPISSYYDDKLSANSTYRRLIDGSKNMQTMWPT